METVSDTRHKWTIKNCAIYSTIALKTTNKNSLLSHLFEFVLGLVELDRQLVLLDEHLLHLDECKPRPVRILGIVGLQLLDFNAKIVVVVLLVRVVVAVVVDVVGVVGVVGVGSVGGGGEASTSSFATTTTSSRRILLADGRHKRRRGGLARRVRVAALFDDQLLLDSVELIVFFGERALELALLAHNLLDLRLGQLLFASKVEHGRAQAVQL